MNKAWIAAGTVGVIAACGVGGYFWAQHQGQMQLQAATDNIRTSLGPNGSFSYTNSQVHPFSRAVDLSGVAMRLSDGRLYTVEQLNLTRVEQGKVGSLQARNLQEQGRDGVVLRAESADARDITFPPVSPGAVQDMHPGAITFAEMTLRGLTLQSVTSSASAQTLIVKNYGAGRSSNLMIDGFSTPVAAAQGIDRAGFGHLTVDGLDLASALDAAHRGAQPSNIARGNVTAVMDNLVLTEGNKKVGEVVRAEVSATQGDGSSAQTARFAATGISFTLPKTGSGLEYVTTLPDVIRADLQLRSSYLMAGGVLDVDAVSLNVENVGKLDAALKLLQVDLGAFAGGGEPDPAAVQALMENTELALATLSFEDKGLRNRIYALGQAQLGATPSQLAELASDFVTNNEILRSLPNGKQIAAAVSNFLRSGGRIEFAVRPPKPLSMADVQMLAIGPQMAARTLGLQVKGEVPPGSAQLPR